MDVVITSAERTDAISFQVTWESPTLEELRGFLDLYVVTYVQLDTYKCLDIDPQTSQIASVEIPSIVISGLVPGKEYCVGVAAKTVEGTGKYTQTLIPCEFIVFFCSNSCLSPTYNHSHSQPKTECTIDLSIDSDFQWHCVCWGVWLGGMLFLEGEC